MKEQTDMRGVYRLYYETDRAHTHKAMRELIAQHPPLQLSDRQGGMVVSEDGPRILALCKAARAKGFYANVQVDTVLTRDEMLSGELGLFLGPGSNTFKGKLPADAFDFSSGCPRCGLGALQVKPFVLTARSIACKGPFYGPGWTSRVMMRAEIGREIIKATGQPWCMRHPVRRDGAIVREWMEAVPTATMPSLSPKSEGVGFGDACPVCAVAPWTYPTDAPLRLVYPREVIEAARRHAIVAMREPWREFPEFDPARRTCPNEFGLPLLLFNRKAMEVLIKYLDPLLEYPTAAGIDPVFAE